MSFSPVTLAPPPVRASLGPKEQGLRLRLAVNRACAASRYWADALDGLKMQLVMPLRCQPRLEATTATGGTALARIEGRRLHFIRIEQGWSLTLEWDLPDSFA